MQVNKLTSEEGILSTILFCYLTFGLTVETFNIKMLVSFYSLTLAVLLATATRHGDVST